MNGFMPMFPGNSNPPTHMRVLQTIQDCEVICEHTISVLEGNPDAQMRVRQLMLLRDCADICGLTAKYIARCSPFAKHMAQLCAVICEACAAECLRFPDAASQHCARVCLHCAQECRAFAMMSM